MIVALGLPLTVAAIILGCILSMLLSVFNALGPISIHTPQPVALTEFFHADTAASVHPLPVSWYLISSVWAYRCSCIQIMSIYVLKLNWIVRNRIVWSFNSLYLLNVFTDHIFDIYVKQDLALNNQQWWIYSKTKSNQIRHGVRHLSAFFCSVFFFMYVFS